jgi:nitrate reductase gamma subunit
MRSNGRRAKAEVSGQWSVVSGQTRVVTILCGFSMTNPSRCIISKLQRLETAMKRLMLILMLAVIAAPLAGCVVAPAGPYAGGGVWVPGHYGPYGGWHPGHYE